MTLYCAGLLPLCYYPYLHQTSQRGHPHPHPHLHRSDNSSRHQTMGTGRMGEMGDVMNVMGTSLDPTFTITINGDNPELDIYINTYLDIWI